MQEAGREAGGGGRTAGEGSGQLGRKFTVSSSPAGHRSRTRAWVGGSSTGCSLSPVPLSCFNWQVPIHRGREGGQGLAREQTVPDTSRGGPAGARSPASYWVSGSGHCGVPTKLCGCWALTPPQGSGATSVNLLPFPQPQGRLPVPRLAFRGDMSCAKASLGSQHLHAPSLRQG